MRTRQEGTQKSGLLLARVPFFEAQLLKASYADIRRVCVRVRYFLHRRSKRTCYPQKICLMNASRRHHVAVGQRSLSDSPWPSFISFGGACVKLCCFPPHVAHRVGAVPILLLQLLMHIVHSLTGGCALLVSLRVLVGSFLSDRSSLHPSLLPLSLPPSLLPSRRASAYLSSPCLRIPPFAPRPHLSPPSRVEIHLI